MGEMATRDANSQQVCPLGPALCHGAYIYIQNPKLTSWLGFPNWNHLEMFRWVKLIFLCSSFSHVVYITIPDLSGIWWDTFSFPNKISNPPIPKCDKIIMPLYHPHQNILARVHRDYRHECDPCDKIIISLVHSPLRNSKTSKPANFGVLGLTRSIPVQSPWANPWERLSNTYIVPVR
jgi:hypothetical protein